MLLPLLSLPLALLVGRQWYRRGARAPTLLVLRVFRRDAEVQALFDTVIERWRLTGNTVLIAGTDLADRTLDADDIFTFLDGGLSRRFVQTAADVAPRLAAFDMARDADGRFRVNECYCHDTTWQDALNALVQRSDVVLMDLRSFRAHNAGCRYELGTLAQSKRPLRVIVLTDGQTDRAAAAEAVAHAQNGRFTWLDTARIDARKRGEVLATLFEPAPAAASPQS
jgi:nucleoside 2-deoxyribosyltransferase